MLAVLLILSSSLDDASTVKSQINSTLDSVKSIADQSFTCMDSNIKTSMKEHLEDASPDVVVDSALENCSYLKKSYFDALSNPRSFIGKEEANKLSEKWFFELRKTYVNHVDSWLIKPEFAKMRSKITLMAWKNCIQEKSKSWSRLSDDATTVGKAAVSNCSSKRYNAVQAMTYEMRSIGVVSSGATDIFRELDEKAKELAAETVILERAKRLPKP